MKTEPELLPQMFHDYLTHNDTRAIRATFKTMEVADISELISEFEGRQAVALFRLASLKRRAEIFAYLDFDVQTQLMEALPDPTVHAILDGMEPVDRTKLLEDLPPELKNRMIDALSPPEQQMARKLLSYPEDSTGRIMSPEFLALKQTTVATEAIKFIRWNASHLPEVFIQNLFVVDDNAKFLGIVTLAKLVTADPPASPISQLMESHVESISAYEDESEAVDYFRKYDRHVIPVVDGGVLVGAISSDDVFDVAEEEATEDIQQFGGSGSLEDSYFNTSKWDVFKKRAGWLAVLFVGMMGTTNALEHFDESIQQMSYLVAFLPMIISSGGNSGSQAASIMIRGLAVKEMEMRDWFRVLQREIVIGLGLGLTLGAMGFARASFGTPVTYAAYIVSLALIGIVTFGAVMGAMLPFILKLLRLDPAVSSSPVISSVMDIVGIIFFFNVAIWIKGFFI